MGSPRRESLGTSFPVKNKLKSGLPTLYDDEHAGDSLQWGASDGEQSLAFQAARGLL